MAEVALGSDDSWTLYALSRVAELLIVSSQPPATDPADDPVDFPLPRANYDRFIAAIGGHVPPADRFHPFLHEIVAVEPDLDPDTPPSLTKAWWPPLMVGSLLVMRGGVTVRAGSRHLSPAAARSTLYWAWIRRYRPVEDLSHGWGSNSQWRTRFRRDYWLPDGLAYNVDAALDPHVGRSSGALADDDVELLGIAAGRGSRVTKNRGRGTTTTSTQWIGHHDESSDTRTRKSDRSRVARALCCGAESVQAHAPGAYGM